MRERERLTWTEIFNKDYATGRSPSDSSEMAPYRAYDSLPSVHLRIITPARRSLYTAAVNWIRSSYLLLLLLIYF
jgi:hypothetical protein